MSYSDAIFILQQSIEDGSACFADEPRWGLDLSAEQQQYLCEKRYKQPIVVMDSPKDIKTFYMRLNDDKKTVASADIILPKMGEVCGGSEREFRLGFLKERCEEFGVDFQRAPWYMDLPRYGTVPLAGFGLVFERLLLLVTGLRDARDVIPFPRWAGNLR